MKVLIAGDFCPQNRVASLLEKGEFEHVLGKVRPIIEQADYSVVNFECPITKGGESAITKCGPNLKCSKKGLEAVKWAGFDCVTLANNHFRDYGDEGVTNTICACKNLGIDIVGGGATLEEASTILYKDIKGARIAIINCCEHEFSIATKDSSGSNPIDPIRQYYSITEARNNADYVIVIVHGGHEHFQLPSLRMVEAYRFYIDIGADAVINHHQHCYSGYEYHKGKPIVYGLGNFCFDKEGTTQSIWNDGYMVEISLGNVVELALYPYTQCGVSPEVSLMEKTNLFYETIERLNGIIADSKALAQEISIYYHSCQNQYSYIFEPIRNRFYYALKLRGWLPSFISRKRRITAANFIGCESHRDKLLFYLNNFK